MQFGLRDAILASMLALFVVVSIHMTNALESIAHRMETATIGGTRVPAVECAEDEVISWLGPDSLGCVHFEEVE